MPGPGAIPYPGAGKSLLETLLEIGSRYLPGAAPVVAPALGGAAAALGGLATRTNPALWDDAIRAIPGIPAVAQYLWDQYGPSSTTAAPSMSAPTWGQNLTYQVGPGYQVVEAPSQAVAMPGIDTYTQDWSDLQRLRQRPAGLEHGQGDMPSTLPEHLERQLDDPLIWIDPAPSDPEGPEPPEPDTGPSWFQKIAAATGLGGVGASIAAPAIEARNEALRKQRLAEQLRGVSGRPETYPGELEAAYSPSGISNLPQPIPGELEETYEPPPRAREIGTGEQTYPGEMEASFAPEVQQRRKRFQELSGLDLGDPDYSAFGGVNPAEIFSNAMPAEVFAPPRDMSREKDVELAPSKPLQVPIPERALTATPESILAAAGARPTVDRTGEDVQIGAEPGPVPVPLPERPATVTPDAIIQAVAARTAVDRTGESVELGGEYVSAPDYPYSPVAETPEEPTPSPLAGISMLPQTLPGELEPAPGAPLPTGPLPVPTPERPTVTPISILEAVRQRAAVDRTGEDVELGGKFIPTPDYPYSPVAEVPAEPTGVPLAGVSILPTTIPGEMEEGYPAPPGVAGPVPDQFDMPRRTVTPETIFTELAKRQPTIYRDSPEPEIPGAPAQEPSFGDIYYPGEAEQGYSQGVPQQSGPGLYAPPDVPPHLVSQTVPSGAKPARVRPHMDAPVPDVTAPPDGSGPSGATSEPVEAVVPPPGPESPDVPPVIEPSIVAEAPQEAEEVVPVAEEPTYMPPPPGTSGSSDPFGWTDDEWQRLTAVTTGNPMGRGDMTAWIVRFYQEHGDYPWNVGPFDQRNNLIDHLTALGQSGEVAQGGGPGSAAWSTGNRYQKPGVTPEFWSDNYYRNYGGPTYLPSGAQGPYQHTLAPGQMPNQNQPLMNMLLRTGAIGEDVWARLGNAGRPYVPEFMRRSMSLWPPTQEG